MGNHCNIFEVRNCRATSDVCAGALSWWRNQLFFFRMSGRLRRMPSLSRFKTSQKTCHWRFDQGVRIPCGQCPGCRGKKRSDGLDFAANVTRFFRPRWIWRLPLRQLLLSLRVVTIHPCFITGYDIGDEVGVVSGLFEFPADKREGPSGRRSAVLAQISQNAPHVQIVRQNALNGPIWQSYYLTNIVYSLHTICKDSLANLLCFPVLCLSTVVQNAHRRRQTFVCPWSICTIKKFCLGSWHYLRRLPLAFGGFLQQFFLIETKFDADSLLLKIGHVS